MTAADPLDERNPGPAGVLVGRSPSASFHAGVDAAGRTVGKPGVRAIWRGARGVAWTDAPTEEAARADLAAELRRLGFEELEEPAR